MSDITSTLDTHDMRAIRTLLDSHLSIRGLRVLRTLLSSIDPLPEPPAIQSYRFVNLLTWTVTHGLGRYPLALALNDSGQLIEGTTSYPDLNTLVIVWNVPRTGTVYITA